MIREILGQGLMITGFVFIIMLLIEYLNVGTRGRWERILARWKAGQSAFCAFLGTTPGCLGAFAVTSLYAHRVVTFGGLTAAMIATCGDEAFLMLALFPDRALMLFAILFGVGTVSGILTDWVLKSRLTHRTSHLEAYQPIHAEQEDCIPFSRSRIVDQWRRCSAHRGWLTAFLLFFVLGIVTGMIGHHHLGISARDATEIHEGLDTHEEETAHEHVPDPDDHAHSSWDWARITLLVLGLIGLWIVATVPDHFLDEHLWNHLARVHLWRILIWTLGALLVTHFLIESVNVENIIRAHRLPILLLACLVGIIPGSGPHLIFVTLYAGGALPFSTLLASSIVQDGHGTIPLLAHSRRAFLGVKAINFAVGLAAGLLGQLLGW